MQHEKMVQDFNECIIQESIKILKINSVQDYPWGQTNQNCAVARISQKKSNFYAQFWMGIHPKGQSKISQTISLKKYLFQNHKEQLNFLFKILSIKKCLSIQVHPNKKQAQILNKQFPKLYSDNNDKPEMFLTISQKFQLFLGFIDQKQILQLFEKQPFKQLINFNIRQLDYKQKIITMLQILVKLDKQSVNKNIQILLNNLNHYDPIKSQIIQRIYKQFNNDIGILVCCLLNYKILQKGQCFGIDAGIPHAYIKGQCFQLMNNSDNVVRLGLTPKQKDVQNLVKIVQNNFQKSVQKIKEIRLNNEISSFEWNRFQIKVIQLQRQVQRKQIQIRQNSIGIVFEVQNQVKFIDYVKQKQYKIKQKQVFFIQKGSYNLNGKGTIYIATRNKN